MNQETLKAKIDLINQIFPDCYYVTANNEISLYCPNCEHRKKKLIVNLEKDLFHCWVCNFGGHISKLIRVYGNEIIWREWQRAVGKLDFDFDLKDYLTESGRIVTKTIQQSKIVLPIEAIKLKNFIPSVIAKNCLQFLLKRGLSYKTIRMYNIHYAEEGQYKDRVIVPSYDENGKLNFFVARSIYDSSDITKYIHPKVHKEDIIFNELLITWEKPIVLVEGAFDAISINRNAVPLLGTSLNENGTIFRKILSTRPEVILMLDNDQPGKDGTAKIGKLLTNWGINTSIAEYTTKDPSELNKKEIIQAIRNRKQLTQFDIMKRILE